MSGISFQFFFFNAVKSWFGRHNCRGIRFSCLIFPPFFFSPSCWQNRTACRHALLCYFLLSSLFFKDFLLLSLSTNEHGTLFQVQHVHYTLLLRIRFWKEHEGEIVGQLAPSAVAFRYCISDVSFCQYSSLAHHGIMTRGKETTNMKLCPSTYHAPLLPRLRFLTSASSPLY